MTESPNKKFDAHIKGASGAAQARRALPHGRLQEAADLDLQADWFADRHQHKKARALRDEANKLRSVA